MATTAADRGWGDPGVPDRDRQRAYAKANIGTFTIVDVDWTVHRRVEPIFRRLLERHVIPAIGPITRVADDWSYAPRCVRGTGPGTGKACVVSNHAWGLAIDVNATENALGSKDRDGQFPPGFGAEVAYLKIRWGGDYTSRADPMHFEFVGTPQDADRIVATFAANDEEDDDMPLSDEDKKAVRAIVREEIAAAMRFAITGENNSAVTEQRVGGKWPQSVPGDHRIAPPYEGTIVLTPKG